MTGPLGTGQTRRDAWHCRHGVGAFQGCGDALAIDRIHVRRHLLEGRDVDDRDDDHGAGERFRVDARDEPLERGASHYRRHGSESSELVGAARGHVDSHELAKHLLRGRIPSRSVLLQQSEDDAIERRRDVR